MNQALFHNTEFRASDHIQGLFLAIWLENKRRVRNLRPWWRSLEGSSQPLMFPQFSTKLCRLLHGKRELSSNDVHVLEEKPASLPRVLTLFDMKLFLKISWWQVIQAMLFLYLMVPVFSITDGLWKKNLNVSTLQMLGPNCGTYSPLPPSLSATCAMGHSDIAICILYESSQMHVR